jgi:type VI secretion system protein VasJ
MMDFMELGKKPIPGEAPAGMDVRTDPDFEALASEIDKLSSPTISGGVDWNRAVTLAGGILDAKSKDLLVMTYLCIALEKMEGLKGLAKGIHVLREAMEAFWEDMFPVKKRMRGRKNAVEWLIDILRGDLPSMAQEQWPKNDRDRFLDDLNAIDAFLAENMEDAPMMIPLIHELASHVVEEAETTSPERPASPPSPSPVAASSGPVQTPSVSLPDLSAMDGEKLIDQGLEVLGRIAMLLSAQDPLNPLAFRLNRIAAWTSVSVIPPATGSKTLIPGPDSQIVGVLQNLHASRSWQDLIQAAESRIRQFLFWFDLNFYAAVSLEQLGRQGAADAVALETLQYINRLPGVERLAFEDGMPFANDQTRSWLKTLSEKQASPAAGTGVGGKEGSREAVEGAMAAARALLREGKGGDALRQFRDDLGRAPSMKERFLWRQGLCRLLVEMRQPRLALPHLHDLLTDIDLYRLEQWEPALAAEAFAVILTGLRQQAEKDEIRTNLVLNRLAALDPIQAMDFL